MATAQTSIIIDRPVEEVFAYTVDIGKLHEWTEVIQDAWPLSGKPTEVGFQYIVKAKFMGKAMEIPSEVVGYELNGLWAYRSTGWMAYEDTMVFEETGAGTRVTERIVMESEGLFSRLLDPIKLSVSKHSHQKNLEMLKDKLESLEVAVAV